jgi:hypothetical protein
LAHFYAVLLEETHRVSARLLDHLFGGSGTLLRLANGRLCALLGLTRFRGLDKLGLLLLGQLRDCSPACLA